MNIRRAAVAVLAVSALTLTACANEESGGSTDTTESSATSAAASEDSTAEAAGGETVIIEDNFGTQEIPTEPETVVVTDNRAFEILADWDVELAAAPVSLIPFTVEEYKEDEDIVDIGNHREPDLEALTAVQPDLIINGQRFQNHRDDIVTLNPDAAILEIDPRDDGDYAFDEELKRQVRGYGEAFGEQESAEQLIADFDAAVERAREAYDPEMTVMAVNVSGGNIGYLAPSVGRTFGALFDIIGMTPSLEVGGASSDHQGDEISVEAIAESNPDLLLVMDRDGGTNTRTESDYTPAQTLIDDNPALQNTTALTEDAVYYAPQDTYTNENIITYTEILNGMADLFESAS